MAYTIINSSTIYVRTAPGDEDTWYDIVSTTLLKDIYVGVVDENNNVVDPDTINFILCDENGVDYNLELNIYFYEFYLSKGIKNQNHYTLNGESISNINPIMTTNEYRVYLKNTTNNTITTDSYITVYNVKSVNNLGYSAVIYDRYMINVPYFFWCASTVTSSISTLVSYFNNNMKNTATGQSATLGYYIENFLYDNMEGTIYTLSDLRFYKISTISLLNSPFQTPMDSLYEIFQKNGADTEYKLVVICKINTNTNWSYSLPTPSHIIYTETVGTYAIKLLLFTIQ